MDGWMDGWMDGALGRCEAGEVATAAFSRGGETRWIWDRIGVAGQY